MRNSAMNLFASVLNNLRKSKERPQCIMWASSKVTSRRKNKINRAVLQQWNIKFEILREHCLSKWDLWVAYKQSLWPGVKQFIFEIPDRDKIENNSVKMNNSQLDNSLLIFFSIKVCSTCFVVYNSNPFFYLKTLALCTVLN